MFRSNTQLILYPGRLIAQLILLKLLDTEARDAKLSGTYLAPIYPEAPTFEDPIDDLNRIGVPKRNFRSPYQDRRVPLIRTRPSTPAVTAPKTARRISPAGVD
jgi:hypothetical protein